MTSRTKRARRASTAIKAIAAAVAVTAVSQYAALAADGGVTETFAEVFGKGATGADVQQKVLAEFDLLEQTLSAKKAAGTLTAEEKAIMDGLPEARRRLAEADGKAYDAIAQLASGETVKIEVPDDKGGVSQQIMLPAVDIEKAQREAANLAAKADSFTAPSATGVSATGASGGPGETTIATASGAENGYYVSVFIGNGEDAPGIEHVLGASGSWTNFLDAAPFETFKWVYGGFHGEKAQPREVAISSLKMKPDGLSFKWVQDLSQWGIANEDYTQAVACLFVMNKNGEWVGGKFDWISSSRNTRDFKNVYSGYNDWNLMDVPNPCPAAFVIVSKDGGKRSNVIGGMWQR
jgi:hypothetical protein